MSERILTLDDIHNIPPDLFPMLCFADNPLALFGFLIKARTKGYYSHFQWLVGPDQIASQWFYFKAFPLSHYAGYSLKLVYNPQWGPNQRALLINNIARDLALPWYRTRYDFVHILGKLLGLDWIQSKRFRICSDTADHLRLVDGYYDLKNPTPSDVNAWTKAHNPPYQVYGRYFAGD